MAAIMDRYTLLHAATGSLLGVGAYYALGSGAEAVASVAVCLVAWELFELYGVTRGWRCGPLFEHESLVNRWVGDLVVGGSCALLAFALLDDAVIDTSALYYFLGGYGVVIVLHLATDRGALVAACSTGALAVAVYTDHSDSSTIRYLTHPLLALLGCCLSYYWTDPSGP